MPDSFQIEMLVAAEPQRVFSAWMDSREHATFTGGGEALVEPWNGGRFIAWDGYIHGILLGVEPGVRIVQTWRTSEFPKEARDSRVTVEFEGVRGGTKVRIRHSDLPPSQVKKYQKGWVEHYLKPLAKYFAKGGKAGAVKSPPPRALDTAWGRQEERKSRRAAAPARKAQKPAARKPAARKPVARKPAARKAASRKRARRPVAKKAARKARRR
jgi:uncharacterized protein YndB with AHSA1/START domain